MNPFEPADTELSGTKSGPSPSRIERLLFGSALPVSRREFLGRVSRITIGVTIGGALLSACGGDDDDDDGGQAAATNTEAGDTSTEPESATATLAESAETATEGGAMETESEEAATEAEEAPTEDEAGEPVSGGTLNVALVGEPQTLDIYYTSTSQIMMLVMHMYETLFTWDEEFQIIPDLVDTHEVTDDGLLNTIHLRQGVLFHNGEELVAADVVASVNRFGEVVGFGQQLMAAINEIREVDDYTIEFDMNEPFGTFTVLLARQNNGCAIYHRSVIEAAGENQITEHIGTGPYQFVEHLPDRHILLERFDDYVYRDEPPNGYGGRKNAYLDEIRFVPVPDEAARVAGLQAGDYHFLDVIGPDNFQALEGDSSVVAALAPPPQIDLIYFNLAEGIMTDINMRRAVQAAVDCEPYLQAAYGEHYRLDPGFMMQETAWYTTAGEELYNIADPALATEYLEMAGYDGAEVRLLATQEYAFMYNIAVVLEQQLGDIGMNIDLQIFDAATWLDMVADPSTWDLSPGGFSFRIDPAQLPLMRCDFTGNWCSDQKVALAEQLLSEIAFEDRFAVWEQFQALVYEEVPALKTGEGLRLLAHAGALHGLGLLQLQAAFWNAWLEQ